VAGTETGDDDDERSRSGRRPVRSPLTHFFPHPPLTSSSLTPLSIPPTPHSLGEAAATRPGGREWGVGGMEAAVREERNEPPMNEAKKRSDEEAE